MIVLCVGFAGMNTRLAMGRGIRRTDPPSEIKFACNEHEEREVLAYEIELAAPGYFRLALSRLEECIRPRRIIIVVDNIRR